MHPLPCPSGAGGPDPPLLELFEVSCYLEQILQNAFESRVGEGTAETSTDTKCTQRHGREQWGLGRDIIDSCSTCHKPMMVEEKTALGSHTRTFPHLHQSNQLPTNSSYQPLSDKVLSKAGLGRQAALAACQLGTCSPLGCCQRAKSPKKFQAGIRQENKGESSFLPFFPALQLLQFYTELCSLKHKPPALSQDHIAMRSNREAARNRLSISVR